MSLDGSLWDDLVATAMLGSERRAVSLPAAAGALGRLLAQLDPATDPAGALLSAAAATALYRRAGALPAAGRTEPAIAPCPPDSRPACSNLALRHLDQLLAGAYMRAVLPEWLAALAAAGKQPPAQVLPALLNLGREAHELRPQIVAVLGERGRWLARLNPAWDYAAPELPAAEQQAAQAALQEAWETGSHAARLTLIQRLRSEQPALARELLAATWSSEKADERTAFLGAFEQGLSMDDEPFLEAALDDRSERVRRAAAELLSSLAGSRLVQRMSERALPLLQYSPGRKARIEVQLPESHDKAMQRDGIQAKPPGTNLGEKAWWLKQMLVVVPPAAWCRAWGATPGEIVAAAMPHEWRNLLLECWSEAARRHNDQPWIEALLAMARAGNRDDQVSTLLQGLALARREVLVIELLQKSDMRLGADHPALPALRNWPGSFSSQLARAVLTGLRRQFAGVTERNLHSQWGLQAALNEFAVRLPPAVALETPIFPDKMRQLPYWATAIDRFEQLIQLRHDMLQAINA